MCDVKELGAQEDRTEAGKLVGVNSCACGLKLRMGAAEGFGAGETRGQVATPTKRKLGLKTEEEDAFA